MWGFRVEDRMFGDNVALEEYDEMEGDEFEGVGAECAKIKIKLVI